MDPFEEFEFKPLTDGLGFHKKKNAGAKTTPEEESFTSKKFIKDQGLSLLDEPEVNPLTTPLPRKKNNAPKSKDKPQAPRTNNFGANKLSGTIENKTGHKFEGKIDPATGMDFDLTSDIASDSTKTKGLTASINSDIEIRKSEKTSTAVDEVLKSLKSNRSFDFDDEAPKAKTTLGDTYKNNSTTLGTGLGGNIGGSLGHTIGAKSTGPSSLISAKTISSTLKSTIKTTTSTATTTPAKEEYKAISFNFSAGFLDAMLILAASILCMIILLVITGSDLVANLTNPDEFGMIYISTLGMIATVAFIYLSVNRVFLGFTPGDWAFDQRLGTPQQLNTHSYGLQVIARSALIVLTGFIILPILSMIMKKDLAGQITGARIMKKS